MYGLIVPPGVSPEVAEALEGTHGSPAIDEMQTRINLLEMVQEKQYPLNPRMQAEYVPDRSDWGYLGEKHGRQ